MRKVEVHVDNVSRLGQTATGSAATFEMPIVASSSSSRFDQPTGARAHRAASAPWLRYAPEPIRRTQFRMHHSPRIDVAMPSSTGGM